MLFFFHLFKDTYSLVFIAYCYVNILYITRFPRMQVDLFLFYFPICTTETTAFICDFESSSDPLCGFTQDTKDNFDWKQSSSSVATIGTGPFSDHTYSTPAGHYLYTESSTLHHKNDSARLISEVMLSLHNAAEQNINVVFFIFY